MSIKGLIFRNLFWLNDFVKGSPVRSHFNDIKYILKDKNKGEERQSSHLNNLLKHAVKHSEFYKKIDFTSIEQFPVMNKVEYVSHHDQIAVDIAQVPFHKGKMHVQKTSGSTGTPLAVEQDQRKRARRLAELKYFGEIAGYKSHEKLAQLRIWIPGQNKSKIQSFRENIFAVDCSKINDTTLNFICDLIQKEKITAMLGYSSWFEHLVKYAEKKSIKLNGIKVIITCSEMLEDDTREKLKELIGCDVVSRYSNEEQGILAQELVSDEQYYLNHASYYFELLKLNSDEKAEIGEIGRIVVTDLFNYAFPMIRYDTGDTGVMAKGNTLSKGYPILSKVYGRRIDLLYDTKGEAVHAMILGRILKNYPGITQWQFIQKDKTSYLLKINGDKDKDFSDCIKQIKNIFGNDANVNIQFVDEIPVLKSGKRKPVISELNNG